MPLPTRNFRVVLAGIWIVSPVAGFRPSRAFLSDLTSFPNPGRTNSPFDFTSRAARVESSSKNSLICARFIPVDSAKWLITSDCVMRFLPAAALVAIVWCNTSNENLELKSKPDTHISHSSGIVFNKSPFQEGFLRKNRRKSSPDPMWHRKWRLRNSIVHFSGQTDWPLCLQSEFVWLRTKLVGARGFEPPNSRVSNTPYLKRKPIPDEIWRLWRVTPGTVKDGPITGKRTSPYRMIVSPKSKRAIHLGEM